MSNKAFINKKQQLGMNPSTASGRLIKDILWDFIVKLQKDSCYRCNTKMSRDTFSIEHKENWLHSDNPLELYFSLDNISFSHKSCNYASSRNQPIQEIKHGTKHTYQKFKCRCELCSKANKDACIKYKNRKRRGARVAE